MRVITTLLCGAPDPQRGLTWPADMSPFIPWAESVLEHGHQPVVLTDTSARLMGNVEVIRVESGPNPYFHRWQVIGDYLSAFDVEPVWCTDGTDVLMLRDPEPEMTPGALHVGADVYPVGCPWMRRTCQGSRRWIQHHARDMLMNAGLLGGSAWDVRLAACMIADEWPSLDFHDMAKFNMVLSQFVSEGWKVIVGDPVNTVMHTWDHTHPTAWFAHK